MGNNRVEVTTDLCTGCGLCASVCPTGTISLTGEKAAASGDECISCGHCEAACPEQAIRVSVIDEGMSRFKTFTAINEWLPHGQYNTSSLVHLMSSRRSCRRFTEKPVYRALLEDLVKIGITAPSGTNSQLWTFTLLPTRKAVMSLGERVGDYYRELNATAEKTILRLLLKSIGKGELDAYYRGYYQKVKEALEEWQATGRDRLFHSSTAAIIVGSRPGASCPAEDALLAAQNILLAAHSMGLGSCLIGFAVAAMKKDPSVKKAIGIPDEEDVHAVIALGYPDETYQKPAGRKKITPRYFEG